MTTSPITLPAHRNRILTRKQERKMLAAALRRRDRARFINDVTYRYRHAMTILAATGAVSAGAVAGHVLLTVAGVR
jgi:hypothetical protein